MAIKIPTKKELFDQIISDINTEFGIIVPLFGRVFLFAMAGVLAGTLKLYYLTIARVQKNIAPDTADVEADGGTLERWGNVKLGRNPFPATNSKYDASINGTTGSVVKAGTTFKSDDNSLNPGKLFILESEVIISASPPDTILIRSLETGSTVSLSDGDTLTSTTPIAAVDKQITILSEVEQPVDAESVELYRARIVEAFQLEPQGGAASDYRIWSGDAQGVRQVYPIADETKCSGVIIFIEANFSDSIDGKGTPTAQIIADVEAVVNFDPDATLPLEERGRRPLQVLDRYEAITLGVIDIDVINIQNSSTEIEADIFQAVSDFLFDVRPFIAGADIPENKNDILSVNDLIVEINNAIPRTTFFDSIILRINSNVIASNFTFLNGDIPTLNSINYV